MLALLLSIHHLTTIFVCGGVFKFDDLGSPVCCWVELVWFLKIIQKNWFKIYISQKIYFKVFLKSENYFNKKYQTNYFNKIIQKFVSIKKYQKMYFKEFQKIISIKSIKKIILTKFQKIIWIKSIKNYFTKVLENSRLKKFIFNKVP